VTTRRRAGELWIEYRPLEELHAADKNPKRHRLEELEASIDRFGYASPMLLDDRTDQLVAGHGRLEVLLFKVDQGKPAPAGILVDNGVWTAPVIRGWRSKNATEAKAMLLADNRHPELGGWDVLELAESLKEITLEGAGLEGIGFTADEGTEHNWVALAQSGDLIACGDHRIICGDATDAATLGRVLGRAKADMVFTDPPYGMSYSSATWGGVEGDDRRRDELTALLSPAFHNAGRHTKPDAAWYVWFAMSTREDFSWALRAAGIEEIETIIWCKPSATLGWGDYRRSYEPCLYAAKVGHVPAFHGDRTSESVWRIAGATPTGNRIAAVGPGIVVTDGEGHELRVGPGKATRRHVRIAPGASVILIDAESDAGDTAWEVAREPIMEHPTQKPVELVRRALANSSTPGQLVLDPFGGSGTTLIGAEQTGRKAALVELEPRYVDTTCRRWQRLTGDQPTRGGKRLDFLVELGTKEG
jgi:site-specific DNA-methyltransferase (adenine-specific)